MLADALGRPLRILLTGGQVHDSKAANQMLDGVEAGAAQADRIGTPEQACGEQHG